MSGLVGEALATGNLVAESAVRSVSRERAQGRHSRAVPSWCA